MPTNTARTTKAERREAARKEAERLAARQKGVERRNRIIIAIASLVVLALLAVAAVALYNESQRTPLSEFEGSAPDASTEDGGITFGSSLEAGSVNEGATEVAIYLDFMCPYCGQFDIANRDDIREMAESGEATIVLHPLNFLDAQSGGANYSTRAANALATLSVQAPESALGFTELMFDNQPTQGGQGLTDEEIADIAVQAGAPQDVADQLAAGTYSEWVAAASDQARNDDVGSTPTILVGGDEFEGNWTNDGELLAAVQGG